MPYVYRLVVLLCLLALPAAAQQAETPPRAGVEMAVLKVQIDHLSSALDQLLAERTALTKAVGEARKQAEWWQAYAKGLEAAPKPPKP
jgi:hypothetical protein